MLTDGKKFLYIFIIAHIFLWTVIPSVFNTNLPLDTIEGLAWGNDLKLGYEKYPPIFPLFTEFFFKIFGNQDWSYYLLSQLLVGSSFIIIFKFTEYFLENSFHRLISVLLLESIYFFNYTTPELNAFIPLFPFLASTALFSWRAVNYNKNIDWVMFGVFAAISTLTYYLALYLLASLSLFFIREIIIYKKFNSKYFLTLISFFLVISPHLYFIFANDLKSIEYALFRSFGDPLSGFKDLKILDHLLYPVIFLIKQILLMTPMLILLRFIISTYKININFTDKKLVFLFTITFLPIVLMFLTSIFGGVRIRTMWMTSFYIFPGIFFIYLYKSKIDLKKFRPFIYAFLFIFLILPIIYGLDSFVQKDKRTDFPGKQIANRIQTTWNNNFINEIEVVAGISWINGGWYGGNLSYNLKSRPILKYSLNEEVKVGSIWIDTLNNIKLCKGVLLKVEPYYEACLIGKK